MTKGQLIVGFWMLLTTSLLAQQRTDSLAVSLSDTLTTAVDSVDVPRELVQISSDGLDAPVEYTARDSMIYDIAQRKVFLYGEAFVKYASMQLQAGYIELDWGENIVTAEGRLDSVGKLTELPQFKDGAQEFTVKRMRYNFETEKGVIYDVRTQQENLYVLGAKSKIVRNTIERGDSTWVEEVVYSSDAIFTTCDHEHPHFGIRSKKQKVIPGKLVVVGPSNLEIAGVPTPLWLPFGFFPITETRTQGLIFPGGYEYSDQWGFGLRGIGYYLPINDNLDLTLDTDIYLKGRWRAGMSMNFNRRYKFNGNLSFNYSRNRIEQPDGVARFDPGLSFQFNLNQAAAAHPTIRIGGRMNIQFNNFQATNFNDAQSVLQGQYSSNLTYSQRFPGKPFQITAGLSHSQNRNSNTMKIDAPNLNFRTNNLYPFKRKKKLGRTRWYEEIAMTYNAEARASVTGVDSLSQFFQRDSLKAGLKAGVKQSASMNTSFTLLKFLNISPNISYSASSNFNYLDRNFIENLNIQIDTIFNPADSTDFTLRADTTYGNIEDEKRWGMRTIHQYNASVSLNTSLYRTAHFKKGWLRGLRHVMRPSLSFSYSPDYRDPRFGYRDDYDAQVGVDSFQTRDYSIFEQSLFSAPSSGERMALSYSISNVYEAKIFSKRDSIVKKIRLLDNLGISGNYNFAADSLNFSRVSASTSTRFFKGLTTVSLRAAWDPYDVNETGRRIDQFYWDTTKKPLRFDGAQFRITTNISLRELKRAFVTETDEDKAVAATTSPNSRTSASNNKRQNIPTTKSKKEPTKKMEDQSITDLLDNFRISHNLILSLDPLRNERDTIRITTHSVTIRGQAELTPNWSVRVDNFGYDFKSKSITYPSFAITRNLHCWALDFAWQPTRRVYSLNLYVKGSPLDFIKVPYRRNNFDARFSGF